MFKFLITIQPLGLMYGSAGAFLSPESLVGRSGMKFPPDASTLSGLFFSANKSRSSPSHQELRDNLYVAGPFWAKVDQIDDFYVPLPRHKVIGEDSFDEWQITSHQWCLKSQAIKEETEEVEEVEKSESEYHWLRLDYWGDEPKTIQKDAKAASPSVAGKSWNYVSVLHPRMKKQERHTLEEDGLFLENAVQMQEDTCLVYLSTYELPQGWYQFGGESHLVEVKSVELTSESFILKKLREPIQKAFALITPAVWGSNALSYRYPREPNFAYDYNKIKLLTDKAVPYRYRIGYGEEYQEEFQTRKAGRLSRGRYAVPPGTVYLLKEPLNRTWWDFPKEWFPEKGLLKKFGCGLCLPVKIEGVDE
ncbi:MAG: CRISPR-associated protein [Symploca sp. SIO2E6]|nr:CRISPR-associated protein [Symploca sp. SIO2E6]